MDVRFKKAFTKDLERLPYKIRVKVEELVFSKIPAADAIQEISNLKKVKCYDSFYCIRPGTTELVLN